MYIISILKKAINNLADLVDHIFIENNPVNGILTLLDTYSFSIQIYCDFVG